MEREEHSWKMEVKEEEIELKSEYYALQMKSSKIESERMKM